MATKKQKGGKGAYQKKWEKEHPGKRRRIRKNYYNKGVHSKKTRTRWTHGEEKLIIENPRPPDVVLSQLLRRTLRAIERKRNLLLRETKDL